jgi:pyruvate,orthophosphate dikinase
VSGVALSGRAVFSLDDIRRFRSQEPGTLLILIRFDTVPDDIREISAADGLLTSRGGATSHASIVAHQLGKTCVVGCSNLMVYEKAGYGVINGHRIKCGDFLSIDGRNGFVYKGPHETTP